MSDKQMIGRTDSVFTTEEYSFKNDLAQPFRVNASFLVPFMKRKKYLQNGMVDTLISIY